MGDLKTCLRRIKAAGYDVSGLDVDGLVAARKKMGVPAPDGVTSVTDIFIDEKLEVLRTEHRDLDARRNVLLAKAKVPSATRKPKKRATAKPKTAPLEKQGPHQQSSTMAEAESQTSALGLPKTAATQEPAPLKNLGKTVAESKKQIVTEEEVTKVAEVVQYLRRMQGTGKEYHELSVGYAIKKAKALHEMKEIRRMFPEETSNIAAMKRFQQVAKNQIAKEKTDETPVFNERQAKQLGAFNREIISQRNGEKAPRGERESSPDAVLEGVTEVEPTSVEHSIEPHKNKEGKLSQVNGIVGIARRLKDFLPGSTLFRTPVGTSGLNTYTIRQDFVEEGNYDGTPQELIQALSKAFVDGRRTKHTKKDGSPNPKVVILYDQKTGEKVPVGSISVTMLGAVVDQTTSDVNLSNTEKSVKQFNAGMSFLMTEGNLTLEKPVTAEEIAVAENKAAISARVKEINTIEDPIVISALESLSLDVLNAIDKVVYMTDAMKKKHPKARGAAEYATRTIYINKEHPSFKNPDALKKTVLHEAGHLTDGELNMEASGTFLTKDMVDTAYWFGHDQHDLASTFENIFARYKEAKWPQEIVAQLFYAHHNNPQRLKDGWPEGFALAEKMHDELRRKREFIEGEQAKRSAKQSPGPSKTAGKQKGGEVQSGQPQEVSPLTVIHSEGFTLGEANKFVQEAAAEGSPQTRRQIRKDLAEVYRDEVITKKDFDAKVDEEWKRQRDEFDPEESPRDTMVTTKEEGIAVEEPEIQRAGQEKKPKLVRTVSVIGDDPPDVRKFESEEAQARRSSGVAKTSPELVGATLTPKEVSPKAKDAMRIFNAATQRDALGDVPRSFVGIMNKLFSMLGIKTKVIVMDKKGAEKLLKEPGLPSQWKNNLQQVLKDQPAGRLMLSDSSVANERFAMVYIDSSKTRAAQQEAFLHELGHIVQLSKLDQASDEVQSALREAHAGTSSQLQFEEWFAHQLLKWVGSNKQAKTVLEQFFKDLAQALKKIWRKLTVDSTYEQFMDSLVAAESLKQGQRPASGKHRNDWIEDMANSVDSPFLSPQPKSFYDMTPEPRGQTPGVSRKGARVLAWGKEKAGNLKEDTAAGFGAFHAVVTQSADAYLRGNGLGWLADHFRKRPDVTTGRVGPGIEAQLRAEQGQFEPSMDKIVDKLPKKKAGGLVTNHGDPIYKKAVDDLIGQVDNPSPLAAQILEYFQEMEAYLKKNGIEFKTRKKYFPVMLDKHQWITRHDRVVSIAMDKLGKTRAQAEQLYKSVAANPSKMFDMSTEYDPRTAGAFGHTQSRTFGPREHKAFQEFIDTDLVSVVKNYTHSAVKHVVYKQHFGVTQGKGKSDPLTQLKNDLTRAVLNGEITQEVYDRTWNTILPALFGQLGANMDPGLRKMQSGMLFFQNVRLLATAVLANLVDLTGVAYRSEMMQGQWAGLTKAIKSMSNKEAQLTYRTLGIIRDDLTEAILNDPTHTQFYTPKIRRLNELFFKANGMHWLTNMSRIYSFTMGKEYIMEKAKAGDTKALTELGLTAAEVLEWDKNGQNYNLDNAVDSNVLYALHQFVDESILRPSASMRPAWMSDQRFLLIANLKSFIFTYYETIIRRVWSQVKNGDFKNPSALLPFIGFAAMALAVSMTGYELRKQLMNAGDVPAYARGDALDYLWEGVQRAGMLGPMQFLVDSVEAESRGKMALMSLLGPTASQFEMLMTEDLSYSLPRSMPLFAQSPALREWIR